MRKILILFASLSFLTLGTRAWADSDPSNDSAAVTIRITPNFERGVQIETGSVHMDLGLVNMGASTQTVSPATVTILGNILNTELNLAASITGGWVFDPNQTFESTGTNQLNVWASFTSISTASAPAQGNEYFRVGTSSGAKIISNTNLFGPAAVGFAGSAGIGRFENNAGNNGPSPADMDGMNPNAQRHLWLYFRLPDTTSVSAEQEIQFQFSVRPGP
ncbi:MAG: hypothetical protein A2901_04320 [Elusimicrobia bacterium RIFCSPLOWO2_01_FULL_54_10]|nr:MAG: hypothetical protein A2901_04320 [Elusimicrobia bacterium RIFCSPLOWO2_01_FULL_54_10]